MADTGLFESLIPGVMTGAAGVSMAKDMTQQGQDLNTDLQGMADTARGETAFKGYGVKTGLGESTVGTDGSLDMGVGPDANMLATGQDAYGSGMGTMDTAAGLVGAGGVNGQHDASLANLAGAQGLMGDNASNAQMGGAMAGLGAAGQGLAAGQAGALGASQGMMDRSMQDNGAREQEIYGRMMAAQQPGMDRARAGMEARAQAQGRGGISGSQYGGSGEQHAQSRAEAEARNSAMLGAMGQSQQEMMNAGSLAGQYGQLGQGYSSLQAGQAGQLGQLGAQNAQLGQSAAAGMGQMAGMQNQFGMNQAQLGMQAGQALGQLGGQQAQMGLAGAQGAYMPMDQQMKALSLGAQNADMAQTGQLTGANLGSQLDLGGAQIELNSGKAASELYGNMFGAMVSPMAGIGSAIDGSMEEGGMLSNLYNDIFGK